MGEMADMFEDMAWGSFHLPRRWKRKKKRGNNLATEYLKFIGNVKWAKVYTADETPFGAVRYSLDFYPRDAEETDRLSKVLNKNKKWKEDKDTGEKYVNLYRDKTKNIKGKLVYFTPPHIYNEDGSVLVDYTFEDNGKKAFSYDNADARIKRNGDPVLIGNGSEVEITLAVFSTAMGNSTRLQSVRIIDLVVYNPEAPKDEVVEDDDGAPWE